MSREEFLCIFGKGFANQLLNDGAALHVALHRIGDENESSPDLLLAIAIQKLMNRVKELEEKLK